MSAAVIICIGRTKEVVLIMEWLNYLGHKKSILMLFKCPLRVNSFHNLRKEKPAVSKTGPRVSSLLHTSPPLSYIISPEWEMLLIQWGTPGILALSGQRQGEHKLKASLVI